MLQEGQVYEGEVAAFGTAGPRQRWIVVCPFGKTCVYSIDNPLDLHHMPVGIATEAIAAGRLRFVGHEPNHPIVRLQRAKQRHEIRDTHMGVYGDNLERMLALLSEAVDTREDYAPYAAGEILAMLHGARYRNRDVTSIERDVMHRLAANGGEPWAAVALR